MNDGGTSQADIAKRIIMLREALGHTQSSFARLVGISQPSMANYETAIRRPELDKAIQIVVKTGVTLDWLYLGDRAGLPGRLLEQLSGGPSRRQKA